MYSPSDLGKRAAPAEGGRAKSVFNTDDPLGTSAPLMRLSSDGGAVSPAAMDVEAFMLTRWHRAETCVEKAHCM